MNKFERDQFTEILNYLIEDTKDGTRQWTKASHSFNSDTSYYMESLSDDGKTRFQCCIKLDSETLVYEKHGCITIYNNGFSGGFKVFGLNDNKDIIVLEKLVYNNFVSTIIPVVRPSSTLGSILGGMGKQYTRNRKLEQLLDGVEESLKIEEEPVKKKGLFERLF
jgi:hypothetical protein